MRAVICALTAAIVMAGCGDGTREITTFERDSKGRIDWTTAQTKEMGPAEMTEVRQQAVHTGVSYIGDCFNGDDNAYGNEAVFYRDTPNNTSPCTYVGGGGSTTWVLGFDDIAARYITQGQTLDNNVKYGKAHVSTASTSNRVAVHVTTTFGGGYVYQNNNVGSDAQVSWGDITKIGSSFVMCAQVNGSCF